MMTTECMILLCKLLSGGGEGENIHRRPSQRFVVMPQTMIAPPSVRQNLHVVGLAKDRQANSCEVAYNA